MLNAREREVGQIVSVAAGYDGRALRYRRPGVRWFELDHPATQADKLRRLARLGIDHAGVTFVAVDLTAGGSAAALLRAGWEPDVPSLMLCERLAVYLDTAVLEALLRDLRAIATRPLVFAGWSFSVGHEPLSAVAGRLPSIQARAERIAARVRDAL